jgi:AcrR family transcriptional regulator
VGRSAVGPGAGLETRTRILDAGEALFAERGFAGTAMRDIARRVGLTPASLYNHFAGKQALYEAVLERGVRPLLERVAGFARAERSTGDAERLIAAIMEHLASRPHLPRLVQHEAISGGAYLSRLAREWIRPLIEQGVAAMKREGDPRWDEGEAPLLIAAWLHLIFGHFALAPLLAEVFDEDPLAPAALARQTRFLRKLARAIQGGPGPDTGR